MGKPVQEGGERPLRVRSEPTGTTGDDVTKALADQPAQFKVKVKVIC